MAKQKKALKGGRAETPKRVNAKSKKVTRYTYNDVKEPRTPETGHTPLLPADEQVVTLPMDNGWSKAIDVGKLPDGDQRPVVVDMDGNRLTTDSLTWNSDNGLISTRDAIKFEGKNFLIEGTGLIAKTQNQQVKILDNVKGTFYRK